MVFITPTTQQALGSLFQPALASGYTPGQEGLVHSASPSSKGKVKGQNEQDRVSPSASSKSLLLETEKTTGLSNP